MHFNVIPRTSGATGKPDRVHRVPSFRVSRNSQEELVRESQTDVGKSKGVSAVFRFLVRNISFNMFVVCSELLQDL